MNTDIKIEGVKELQADLARLVENISGQELTKIVKNAGKPMVASAKSRAPMVSGLLKSQVGFIEANDKQNPGVALIGVNYKGKGRKRGNSAYYAHIVEYGGKTTRRTAKPFMAPAFNLHKDRAAQNIIAQLRKLLDKLTKNKT
jgi:HK97 gp10 family phage protein